jgi:hypothetical protein
MTPFLFYAARVDPYQNAPRGRAGHVFPYRLFMSPSTYHLIALFNKVFKNLDASGNHRGGNFDCVSGWEENNHMHLRSLALSLPFLFIMKILFCKIVLSISTKM